jgi:hypothetical protein
MEGRALLALLGGIAVLAVGAVLVLSHDNEGVGEFESSGDPPLVVTVADVEPVLSSYVADGSILTSLDNTAQFCIDLRFAETPCGGVLKAYCAELGSTHPDCVSGLASYCAAGGPLRALCEGDLSN